MTTSPDDLLGLDGAGADGAESPGPDREIVELRRQLRAERERSLNATDRVLGAQAEAAQARAQIKELEYVLHVREAELARLKDLVDQGTGVSSLAGQLRAATGPVARTVGRRLRAITR